MTTPSGLFETTLRTLSQLLAERFSRLTHGNQNWRWGIWQLKIMILDRRPITRARESEQSVPHIRGPHSSNLLTADFPGPNSDDLSWMVTDDLLFLLCDGCCNPFDKQSPWTTSLVVVTVPSRMYWESQLAGLVSVPNWLFGSDMPAKVLHRGGDFTGKLSTA